MQENLLSSRKVERCKRGMEEWLGGTDQKAGKSNFGLQHCKILAPPFEDMVNNLPFECGVLFS